MKIPSISFITTSLLSIVFAVFWSWILTVSFANGTGGCYDSAGTYSIWKWKNTEEIFEKYLEKKNDNADRWLTFTGILCTVFAVFLCIVALR